MILEKTTIAVVVAHQSINLNF